MKSNFVVDKDDHYSIFIQDSKNKYRGVPEWNIRLLTCDKKIYLNPLIDIYSLAELKKEYPFKKFFNVSTNSLSLSKVENKLRLNQIFGRDISQHIQKFISDDLLNYFYREQDSSKINFSPINSTIHLDELYKGSKIYNFPFISKLELDLRILDEKTTENVKPEGINQIPYRFPQIEDINLTFGNKDIDIDLISFRKLTSLILRDLGVVSKFSQSILKDSTVEIDKSFSNKQLKNIQLQITGKDINLDKLIEYFPNLENINVSNHNLIGNGIYDKVTKLEAGLIHLDIPTSFPNLISLRSSFLQDNQLSQSLKILECSSFSIDLNVESIEEFPSIHTLSIGRISSGEEIKPIPFSYILSLFPKLVNLKINFTSNIEFSNGDLESIPVNRLEVLRILPYRKNQTIPSINLLQKLPYLRELYSDDLLDINEKNINLLASLDKLSIKTNIPPEIKSEFQLTELQIHQSNLVEDNNIKYLPGYYPKLKVLIIDGAMIKRLDLSNIGELEYLNIDFLHPETKFSPSTLKSLRILRTSFSIYDLRNFEKLQNLSLRTISFYKRIRELDEYKDKIFKIFIPNTLTYLYINAYLDTLDDLVIDKENNLRHIGFNVDKKTSVISYKGVEEPITRIIDLCPKLNIVAINNEIEDRGFGDMRYPYISKLRKKYPNIRFIQF